MPDNDNDNPSGRRNLCSNCSKNEEKDVPITFVRMIFFYIFNVFIKIDKNYNAFEDMFALTFLLYTKTLFRE